MIVLIAKNFMQKTSSQHAAIRPAKSRNTQVNNIDAQHCSTVNFAYNMHNFDLKMRF